MRITLLRVAVLEIGAYGVLLAPDGRPFAVTLERTYADPKEAGINETYGAQHVKLVEGVHTCRPQWFVHGGYQTLEVICPGHTEILFHRGTVEAHSEGCILVARSFAEMGIQDGSGLYELFRVTGLKPCELAVRSWRPEEA